MIDVTPRHVTNEVLARWSRAILELPMEWLPGAILPTELALFLTSCELAAVDAVVESGRQDGYSTRVLAAYGERMRVPVVSIDVPPSPERGERARARLDGLHGLTLLDGNSMVVLPSAVPRRARRVALLIDGPKTIAANALMQAACIRFPVVLLAYHGHDPSAPDGVERVRLFDGLALADPWRYARIPEVRALLEIERGLVRRDPRPRRHGSTLAIARLPERWRAWRVLRRGLASLPSRLARYAAQAARRDRSRVPPGELLLLKWAARRAWARA